MEIDDIVVKLLALHQPMAVDLRFLTAAMKDQQRPGTHRRHGRQRFGQTGLLPPFQGTAGPPNRHGHSAWPRSPRKCCGKVWTPTPPGTWIWPNALAEDAEEDRLKAKALKT
jgi:hypothetical protein